MRLLFAKPLDFLPKLTINISTNDPRILSSSASRCDSIIVHFCFLLCRRFHHIEAGDGQGKVILRPVLVT
jgi:hypothetical protein